ncbi:MAG: alpha/beta fold hydrolase [Solobacterium sp.]|nr:alpha/beta fold hydrolase [Solobacterium sp.]
MYREEHIQIPFEDYTIPAVVTLPEGSTEKGVVMLHGTGTDKDEAGNGYITASRIFAEDYGLASIRIDWPGYGESQASPLCYDFTTAVRNAATAATVLQTQYGIPRTGVMGWSQGGSDALLAAGNYPDLFRAVVTWAGALDLSAMITKEDIRAAVQDGYFVMDFDWREAVPVSAQWVEDALTVDILETFAFSSAPVLAIAGEDDDVVDPDCAQMIVEASDHPASAVLILPQTDHVFHVLEDEQSPQLLEAVHATGDFFRAQL